MGRSDGVDDGTRRRTVLKLLSVAAGAQLVPWAGADQVADRTFSVVQGDRCIPVTPIVGDESVEGMYDWREDETHYSSAGTMDLQRQDTSILFLYVGPDGLSLVLVHGHYQNHDSDGGSVSMTFTGLPETGEWVVEDDNYDGSENYDNWNHESTRSEIDWTWRFGRTDGGAFRGLEGEFEIQIEPAFNDASHFGDEFYDGDILEWQVLSGDRDNPDRTTLALDQPITLRVGSCDASDETEEGDGGGTEEDEETTEEDGTEDTDEGDGEGEEGDSRADVVVDEDTDGNIETDGSVVVETGVEVDGNVEAGGSVDVRGDGDIDGNVAAGDGVSVGSGSNVDGNVDAGGDVSVGPDGEIDGNVESGGTVSVRSDSEIEGNVTGASVEVADSAEVDGEIEGEEESGGREADSDDDSEDRRRTKHEKRQRKHEKEEEKKERKHRKKQRKHEKEEEKKERKHRKKQRKHDKGNSAGIGDTLDDVTGLLDGDD